MLRTRKYEGLEIFTHIIESGSFSAAADRCGVSKAHVSKEIKKLEERLGVQLFLRTTRQISATEAAIKFYEQIKNKLLAIAEAEQDIMNLQDEPSGILKVTAAGEYGEKYVTPAAIEFMQQYPDIQVDLVFTDNLVDLIDGGYDLAIRSGNLADSSLIARKITERKLTVCCSPKYITEHGKPETLADLKEHNCLAGSVDYWTFNHQNQDINVKISGNWRSNNGSALVQAACSGIGIIQLPEIYIKDLINAGELVTCLESLKPAANAIWAVSPFHRHHSNKVRLFTSLLVRKHDK